MLLIGDHRVGVNQMQTLFGELADLLGDCRGMDNPRLTRVSRVNQTEQSRGTYYSLAPAWLLRGLEEEQVRALAVSVFDLNLNRLSGFCLLAGFFGIEDLIWVLPAVGLLRRIVHKDNSVIAEVLSQHPQLLSEQHDIVNHRTIRIGIWIDL